MTFKQQSSMKHNNQIMALPLAQPILSSLRTRAIIVHKPQAPDALILLAWAQGYMVGSIIVMIAITIANMRRGVLLHKLILLEVSPVLESPDWPLSSHAPAPPWGLAWYIHLPECSSVRLVPFGHSCSPECVLEPTQCCSLAQKQALFE